MKFGIEIELVGMNQAETTAALNAAGIETVDAGYCHTTMPTWKVVRDSSVPNGCEVVSPPMDLTPESVAIVANVCQVLNDHGADVDKSCGLHVHVDVSQETPQTIAAIFNRYKKFEAQIDLFMPRSRRGSQNGYCQSLASQADLTFTTHDEITNRAAGTTRYLKVNLNAFAKYKTIEFRQHGGTLNASKITKWVHFLTQFVIASRQTAPLAVRTQDAIIRSLPVKKQQLLAMLRSTPMNSQQLSVAMGYTSTSRTNKVLRDLRAVGLQIIVKPNGILQYIDQSAAASVIVNTDTLYNGIEDSVRVYYIRRAGLLA